MCGRFALTLPSKKVMAQFNIKEEVDLKPRYNIAPSQQIAVVRQKPNFNNELLMMRWGLIPFWAKDTKMSYKMINARGETLAEKPSFKGPFKKRRCLIPANGFYEWQKIPGEKMKQPHFIHMKGKHLFAFAGLWEEWENPADGKMVLSCTIVTTGANKLLSRIHDRMPVIVKESQYGIWLGQTSGPDRLNELIRPYDPFKMSSYKVSGMCNKAEYDAPGCIKRVQ